MTPPLLVLATEDEYKQYYYTECCSKPIVTHDGIKVFCPHNSFDHITRESSRRDGIKDVFSTLRAQRLPWIRLTLESASSILYKGFDTTSQSYLSSRRVAVCYDDFVVIMALSLNKDGILKGNLVTCYVADNSISKIRTSPLWSYDDCMNELI